MFARVKFNPEAHGPLEGIRILDLSRLVAGNTLTMTLADLGAEVLKVEPPAGDTLRHWKVHDVETVWKTYSRNKRSLCIDFRHDGAKDLLMRLSLCADVLIESFRPGTLESMGLAPAALWSQNPRLIIARISGWGQDGPYSHRPGFGTLVEGMSGFASMNGFPDREPLLPPIYLGDMAAGLYGALGVLAAVRNIEVRGGTGQVIDIPLLDPLFSILGAQAANYRLTGNVKPRTGSRSTNSAPRNVYRTLDNRWVCLSASTEGMADKLFGAIGRPELSSDPRFGSNSARLKNIDELDKIVGDFIGGMSMENCLTFFEVRGITVGPIYTMADIENDQHFKEREIVVELPDAEMGTIPVHTISPRLGGTPGGFRMAAPALGEHSVQALREAGFSNAEVDALAASGLVFTRANRPRSDHA